MDLVLVLEHEGVVPPRLYQGLPQILKSQCPITLTI